MKKYIYGIVLFTVVAAYATTKYIDADAIRSGDHTKTWTPPSTTQTLVGRTSTDTLINKSISGSSNTITNVSLSTGVTSTLPVGNGGTGQTSLTTHGVLVGAGSSNVTVLTAPPAGTVLAGQGASSDPSFSSTPTFGIAGTTLGTLALTGNTSGTITIQPQAAAGTYNFNLPTTAGSNGQVLTSAGGGSSPMTWTSALSNPMNAAGQMIYGGTSGAVTAMSAGTSGQVPISAGTSVAMGTLPGNSTALKAPTIQKFTATGTQTGWLFTISTSSTVAAGDTYTNNANTYTVLGALSAQSGQVLFMSGTGATSGGTLSRSAGAGTSSITFTSKVALATYTLPTNPSPLYLKIQLVGGGGGGAGTGSSGSGGTGNSGTNSYFGPNLISANGGGGATLTAGGAGGAASIGTAIGYAYSGSSAGGSSNSVGNAQTNGVATPFGGAGGGAPGAASAGQNAIANTGSGGGGASETATSNGGPGGGASGYANGIITTPAATYPYVIGTKGAGGTAGTSGFAGGDGADGVLIVEEIYQ